MNIFQNKKLPGKTREVVFVSFETVWFALYSWFSDYRSLVSFCHVRESSDLKIQNIIRIIHFSIKTWNLSSHFPSRLCPKGDFFIFLNFHVMEGDN